MTTKLPTNLLNTGAIVDRAYAEYTANADLSALIPIDDTIPQVGEGTQILSASLTPKSTTNRIRGRVQVEIAGSGNYAVVAAFVNGGANAVASTMGYNHGGSNGGSQQVLEFEYVPGSLSAQAITIRVGASAGTIRVNGATTTRLLGGTMKATLILEEISA